MATWHPPIPAGKLYSEPSLQLGPGMAMLAWCYDNVQRDGTVEIRLERIALDIGKPYGTIRDWWRMLRSGPFFCEQIDRGKRGWVVRLANDWLDWHVMRNNYPVNAEISTDTELSPNDDSRDVSVENVESSVNAASKLSISRNVSVEPPAYKVLHDDQKTGGVNQVSEAEKPPRPLSELALAIADVCKINPKVPTERQKHALNSTYLALKEIGATAEQVRGMFTEYWYSDSNWTTRNAKKGGYKPDAPNPSQVLTEWPKAEAAAALPNRTPVGDVPLVRAGPRAELSPEERAQQAERRRKMLEESRGVGK